MSVEYSREFLDNRGVKEDDIHAFRWSPEFRRFRDYNPTYLNAAVFRNPFSRLVSCYFDKISNEEDSMYLEGISFKDWALSLSTDKSINIHYDGHWRPMIYELQIDDAAIDEFIRLENINEDMAPFLERVGLPAYDFKNRKAKFRRYVKPFQHYYDRETFDHVSKVYDEDIDYLSHLYSKKYEDYI
jgi:hypothetical protein